MLKMNLKCTRCKAGWVAEGMPEQFYRDALNEFLSAHKECAPTGGAVDNGVQHTQPEIFARAADDWFAINDTATIRQAFIAGARYAQKHPASA